MREWDQVVSLAVHEERWAINLRDLAHVVKAVLDEIFQQITSLVFCNRTNGLKRAHKQQTSWIPDTCNMGSWPRPHASAEDDHVFLVDTQHLIQVIEDVL